MSAERRRDPRFATALKVRLDGPHGRQHLVARDLSVEGMFVECPKVIRVGQVVECRLELSPGDAPTPSRVELVAEVRHQTNAYVAPDGGGPFKGVGLRFVRLTRDAQSELRRYLERGRSD